MEVQLDHTRPLASAEVVLDGATTRFLNTVATKLDEPFRAAYLEAFDQLPKVLGSPDLVSTDAASQAWEIVLTRWLQRAAWLRFLRTEYGLPTVTRQLWMSVYTLYDSGLDLQTVAELGADSTYEPTIVRSVYGQRGFV